MPSRPRHSALSPEYALLGFLTQRAAHGYDLHQQLTTQLGDLWRVSLSQTYNILNRLEAQGFIAGTLQEQEKLPDRRRFRLTAAGRGRFENWLQSTAGCSVRAIRIDFTTRLYFSRARGPEVVRNLIETQIAEVRGCLTRIQALLTDLPPDQTFNRLGLELRLRQLTSLIDWLAECGQVLGVRVQS